LTVNAKVLIVVSSGPADPSALSTSVPTVHGVGVSLKKAQDDLVANNLKSATPVYWSGTGLAAGYVADQIPAAGTKVQIGTQIVLIVAK
jgi:beta-lactam-binding protein with PASTA domain